MKKISSLLLVLFFLQSNITIAQRDSTVKALIASEAKSYWTDGKALASKPFQWKGKNWGTFAAISAGVGGAMLVDRQVHDFSQRHQNISLNFISKNILEPWGSGIYSIPLLVGLGMEGIITNNSRNAAIALSGAKAFVFSGLITQVLKYSFHRVRPYQTDAAWKADGSPVDPFQFYGPFSKKAWQNNYTSFPSGHTTAAFAVATVLAESFKQYKALPFILYGYAGAVGLSRIYDDKHWLSDVVLGAAIGYTVGKFVTKRNVNLVPFGPGGQMGFSMIFKL